jgi:hypothetical protein
LNRFVFRAPAGAPWVFPGTIFEFGGSVNSTISHLNRYCFVTYATAASFAEIFAPQSL